MRFKLFVLLFLFSLSISLCFSQSTTLSVTDPVTTANVTQGTIKHAIFHFHLARSSTGTVNLTGVTFTTAGSYQSSDITRFQFWTNTSDAIGTATQLSSDISTGLGTGSHSFDTFSQLLSPSATRYFWITTDVSINATLARTINVAAWSTTNFTVDNGTKSGSVSASGVQSITAFASLSTDYFRSKATGDWGTSGTWESSHDNNNWASATSTPTSSANIIQIITGNTVTIASGVSIDQTTVNDGGQLNVSSGITLTIANGADAYDLAVNGILRNNGGTITTTGALAFGISGKYQHNYTTTLGTIPTATWNANSTCEIIGYTTAAGGTLGGFGQSFGNFTWNCPSQTTGINAAATTINVAGDMSIIATNTGQFSLTTTTFTTLNISGSLAISGGTFYMSSGSGISTINLSGNLTISGGTLSESSSGSGTINFAGNSPQVLSITNSPTISNTINFAVNSGAILEFENSSTVLNGTGGSFTANSGSTLMIKHAAGIAPQNTYAGCIQNSGNRTYNVNANYTYAGTSTQVSGTGYPTGGTGTLKVNTESSVSFSLSASRTLGTNGKVNLASGIFTAGTALTLGTGSLVTRSDGTMTGTIQGSAAYSVVYNGDSKSTGNELTGTGLGNITIDLNDTSSSLTLDRSITVDNLEILAFSQGSLTLSNYNLIMNGSYSGSNLFIYSGTGALGGGNIASDINIRSMISPSSLPSSINTLDIAPGIGNTVSLPNNVTTTALTFTNGNLAFNSYSVSLAGQDFSLTGSNSISALSVALSDSVHIINGNSSIAHTWQTNGALNGTLNINFSYSSSLSTANMMSVYKRDHTLGESIWNYVDNIAPVDHGTYYTVTVNNVTTLNGSTKGDLDWTLVASDQELSVELSSFTVTLDQQTYVTLEWITQSETNESGYNIYRNNCNDLSTAVKVNANLIPATNTSYMHTYYFRDVIVTDDDFYYYWLQDISNNGVITFHGPVMVDLGNSGQITPPPSIPLETSIQSIFPNPFAPNARINYGVAVRGFITIHIYNAKGQIVRTLLSEMKDANNYHLVWDGRNMNGRTCPSGVYIFELKSGKIKSTVKATLIR